MIYKETFEEGITKMHSSDKHFIWIKLDHSFFHIPDDIYLCGAYIPPANSTYFYDEDDMTRTAKTEIKMLYEGILDEKLPDDVSVQRIGKKAPYIKQLGQY